MLRRCDIKRVARPKKKKMIKVPFMPSRAVLKDKEEIDAIIRVILPPDGGVITIGSIAIFRSSYHPGAHIEIGLEDLLQAIVNYRTIKPIAEPRVNTIERLRAGLKTTKEEVKDKPPSLSPPPVKRLSIAPDDKKKKKDIVSSVAVDKASAIRNMLRNKPTVQKKKKVTTRKEPVIVRPVAEPVIQKMSLAEMGVEFGRDAGNVPQRYDEIQEKLARLKGTP